MTNSVLELADQLLTIARTPICVGKQLIQTIAEHGQWVSADGFHGLVAADGLFRNDPYKRIAELEKQVMDLEKQLQDYYLSDSHC